MRQCVARVCLPKVSPIQWVEPSQMASKGGGAGVGAGQGRGSSVRAVEGVQGRGAESRGRGEAPTGKVSPIQWVEANKLQVPNSPFHLYNKPPHEVGGCRLQSPCFTFTVVCALALV